MATTIHTIRSWINRENPGMDYMIVVCDMYDWEDYPVYCTADELTNQICKFNGKNMQKIMEVYDLNADIEKQLSMHRAGLDLVDKARQETKD